MSGLLRIADGSFSLQSGVDLIGDAHGRAHAGRGSLGVPARTPEAPLAGSPGTAGGLAAIARMRAAGASGAALRAASAAARRTATFLWYGVAAIGSQSSLAVSRFSRGPTTTLPSASG